MRIRFVGSSRFIHVDEMGRLAAARRECPAHDVACTYDRLPTQRPGFFALRSRLTGHFVRLIDQSRPDEEAPSDLGARPPYAKRRERRPRRVWSSEAETEQCTCPLRPGGKGGGVPPGWRYNCSTHLPMHRRP